MIESSVSRGKFDLLQESGERSIEAIECALGTGRTLRRQRAGRSEGEQSDEVDEELGAFPDKSLGLWRLADLPSW